MRINTAKMHNFLVFIPILAYRFPAENSDFSRIVFVTTPDNPSGYCPPRAAVEALASELAAFVYDRSAATAEARRLGIEPLILGDALEGEAREVGKVLAGVALSCARHGSPARKPCVLLSGGETTVTVRGQGRGGRNSEFLLGLALALDGAPGIDALAADTDGIDGSEDNAGAFIGPDTLARAQAAGVDVRACLAGNDAWYCFSQLGDLLVTGPTRTNVNDFRAILIR